MNRRGFLGALLAGATLDPERLLWRPGAKLISIPSPPRAIWFEAEPICARAFRLLGLLRVDETPRPEDMRYALATLARLVHVEHRHGRSMTTDPFVAFRLADRLAPFAYCSWRRLEVRIAS
jgi:hypothetical protein